MQVLTVNAYLAIFLRRAMVLNHEQDAPPVRTLLNKVCFTKAFGFYVRKNNGTLGSTHLIVLYSLSFIHVRVILLVLTRSNIIHPSFVL